MGPERAASVRTKRRHVVGGLRRFSPGSRSPSSRLQVLMTISFAMRWLASPGPLQHGGVDVERRPDDEAASVRQGVPVVLPARQGSPGGSYGTADEGAPALSRGVPGRGSLTGRPTG